MKTSYTQKNKIIYALTIIGAALSFYYYLKSTENTTQPAAKEAAGNYMESQKPIKTTEKSTPDEKIIIKEPLKKTNPIADEKIFPATTEAAITSTILQWQESRGLYTNESLTDYLSYDWDTLNKLSSDGDIKAMMALANLSLTEPYIYQRGIEYYNEILKRAAIYGSSEALSLIAIKSPTELSGDTGRQTLLESLAWNNTAALRGDIYPLGSALQNLIDNNITLSSSEVASIHERSQKIYNELLQEREKLGLGPFDNSAPTEIKQYQEYLKHRFKDGFKLFEVN